MIRLVLDWAAEVCYSSSFQIPNASPKNLRWPASCLNSNRPGRTTTSSLQAARLHLIFFHDTHRAQQCICIRTISMFRSRAISHPHFHSPVHCPLSRARRKSECGMRTEETSVARRVEKEWRMRHAVQNGKRDPFWLLVLCEATKRRTCGRRGAPGARRGPSRECRPGSCGRSCRRWRTAARAPR